MAILYHWRDINFYRDITEGNFDSLEQNAPWLDNRTEVGQQLWAFTRNARQEYVLVVTFRIQRIERLKKPGRYGRYAIYPEPQSMQWFDYEHSPTVETLIRELSIDARGTPLGTSFRGHSAIRRITPSDEKKLEKFAQLQSQDPRTSSSSKGHATLCWLDQEDRWIDMLPLRFFTGKSVERQECHRVSALYQSMKPVYAYCLMTTRGATVRLDYMDRSVRSKNVAAEMDIGVLTLHFSDERREIFEYAVWQDENQSPDRVNVQFDWPIPEPAMPYKRPSGAVPVYSDVPRKERPGQASFRKSLEEAYGQVCCLTGCTAVSAIEAAHIDPHQGTDYDHPQNGLLLRRDLHALFDAGDMVIDPHSRIVYFSPGDARESYEALQGVAKLCAPHQQRADRSPASSALERRWTTFHKRFGDPR